MTEILREMLGKKVDVNCGAGVLFSGEAIDLRDDVMVLRDADEKVVYIAVRKIVAVTESSEAHSRPGFVG